MRIENAIIKSTLLGYEDHGFLTCYIFCEGDGWGCGFGGYGLSEYDKEAESHVPIAISMKEITEILKTLDVGKWEELPGQFVRVEYNGSGSGGIIRIGHLIKDQWFSFKEFFEDNKSDG